MEDKTKALLCTGAILLFGGIYIAVLLLTGYYVNAEQMILVGVSIFCIIAIFGMIYKMTDGDADCGTAIFVILALIGVGVVAYCNVGLIMSAEELIYIKPEPVLNDLLQLEEVKPSIFYKALVLTPAYGNTAAIFWLAVSLWKGDSEFIGCDLLQWTPLAYVQAYIVSIILLAIFSVETTLIIMLVLIGIFAFLGIGAIIGWIKE